MQNEGKNEVFRGHLEECLEHLGKSLAKHAPKGSRRRGGASKFAVRIFVKKSSDFNQKAPRPGLRHSI